MADATVSPLKAAADLFGELMDRVDPGDAAEVLDALESLGRVRPALKSLDAKLEAYGRADRRERLCLIEGGGDDA